MGYTPRRNNQLVRLGQVVYPLEKSQDYDK